MLARKCDVCGTLYDMYSGEKEYKKRGFSNALVLVDTYLDDTYRKNKKYDLCRTCMDKLLDLLSWVDKLSD